MRPFFRALLVFLLGLLLHPAGQAVAQKTLLFEVTKPAQKGRSYLYGTMHRVDSAFLACEGFFRERIRECEVFSGELDFNQLEANQELARAMMLQDTLFSELFTEEEYAFVKAEMSERWGPMASSMERLKPFWLASLWAADGEEMFDPEAVVDVRLQRMAEEEMLGQHPLETVGEQLSAIERIEIDEQVDYLLKVMRDSTSIEQTQALTEAYSRGRLDEIEKIYLENRLEKGAEGALIVARNEIMATRLQELLERELSVFCAVGALHLIGETGLIARLNEMGYTLKAVDYLPCD